ncbi:MAG: hypothetical protein PHE09_16645 [Oscillospiraceae bacterium]|nr:hypothetical protein [Oscillospiraceae bacterium]
MTALDSPCYLCQRRTPHCHIQCKDYIAYTHYRQALSRAKQTDTGLQSYSSDRYFRIQRRIHNGK